MKVTLLINDNDSHTPALHDDINAFLHFHARAGWQMQEEDATEERAGEDEDEPEPERYTLLTIEFSDPLDAVDFMNWRDIRRHVRRA